LDVTVCAAVVALGGLVSEFLTVSFRLLRESSMSESVSSFLFGVPMVNAISETTIV